MTSLERICRLLLLAYPAEYRRDRGEEIIGTLLEATPPWRRWPFGRDIVALVLAGLHARAARNRRLTTAGNLRLAIITGAVAYLAFSAVYKVKMAVLALTAPADSFGHLNSWHLLVAAAVVGVAVALVWVSRRRTLVLAGLGVAAVAVWMAGPWYFEMPLAELVCLAALALLGGRGERPRRALLVPVAVAAALPLVTELTPGFWAFPSAVWVIAAGVVSLLWMVIDARPFIATAVFVLAFALPEAVQGAGPPPGGPLMLIVGTLGLLAVWPLHRQSARTAPDGARQ